MTEYCDVCDRSDIKLYHVFDHGDFWLCWKCRKEAKK